MSQLVELKTVYQGLQTLYQTYLPKVDSTLIDNLLIHEQENRTVAPFYIIEVFTKPGTDSEWCKNHILETTGEVSAVYDNGTHYVTNMRLTLEILKKLNDFDFVVEVTGDYTGSITGIGASHEHRDRGYIHDYYPYRSASSALLQQLPDDKTIDRLREIKIVYQGLQTLYQTYLPKVDSTLIHDLLVREEERSQRAPFYLVEIFTKEGTDSEAMRNRIMEKTGMVPAIYDKGTHYVTNQRLSLEMLKDMSDAEDVTEITGDYTGGITARGASHEPGEHKH